MGVRIKKMFVAVGADPWEVRSPPELDHSGMSRRAQRRGCWSIQRVGTGGLPGSMQSIAGCGMNFAASPLWRGTTPDARPERPRAEMCQREGVSTLLAPEKQGCRGFRAILLCTSPVEEVFTSFRSQARAPSLAQASVCSSQGVYSAEHFGRGATRGPGKPGGCDCPR